MEIKILNALKEINKKHPKLKGIKISIKEEKNHATLQIRKNIFQKKKIILTKKHQNKLNKLSPKELEKLITKNLPHTLENQTLPMIQLIGIALEYSLSPGKHNVKELFD